MNKIAILLVFLATHIQAQKRYEIDKGKIDFTSNAAIELITGSDEKVQGLVDPAKNTFAFIVNMKGFSGFNSALQKEHFNEKYLETDKFYQATFSGSFIDPVNYEKEGVYKVQAKGFLTIHGIKQTRIIPGTITIAKGKMVIDANFVVPLADHGIKIPEIVSQKIATEINVKLKFDMKEKVGKGA
jgi:polyisoprenoid-binding protein YceI